MEEKINEIASKCQFEKPELVPIALMTVVGDSLCDAGTAEEETNVCEDNADD